jgi:hypothetical protein
MKRLGAVLAISLACSFAAQAGDYLRPAAPGWSERVQLVYSAADRSVERRSVRVWNPRPDLDLDFVWEPDADEANGGLAADGTIAGRGHLVWRVKGSPAYDPRTVYSRYTGTLRHGRPDGKGRLELRSGETVEGDWVAGQASGTVVWVDASGNRYEGDFVDGRPHGRGIQRMTTGEIYSGPFAEGRRHGLGRTRMAGGTVYASTWDRGREVGSHRPDVLADAQVGGLLRAQAGGGDAGKVEIGIAVEERMNQRSDMRYQQMVRDEDIAIYPESQELNDLWNGNQPIPRSSYMLDAIDWTMAPAFVAIDVGTSDGSRVRFSKLQLKVATSQAYRKPMLTSADHYGCVGFRPDFEFVNHGWGAVKNPRLSLRFTTSEEGKPTSRDFQIALADFDAGADISVREVLDQAGVNTAKLETERFSCQSRDSLNVCRSQVFNSVGFGEIADFVEGEDNLSTTVRGTLSYEWSDDAGASYAQAEPFSATISLATIELPPELSECGDGFGGQPDAMRYQDVDLPLGKDDYAVDIPIRGNKTLSTYTARLKLHSQEAAYHQMRVAATFADGSVRESKPLTLFYFRPRPVTFVSALKPAACYLPALAGC